MDSVFPLQLMDIMLHFRFDVFLSHWVQRAHLNSVDSVFCFQGHMQEFRKGVSTTAK